MCSMRFAPGTELSCRITGEVTVELQRRVRRVFKRSDVCAPARTDLSLNRTGCAVRYELTLGFDELTDT